MRPISMGMRFMWKFFYQLASPKTFYVFSGRLLPLFAAVACLSLSLGIFWGLFWAPADYQQGDAFRILYIHVPSAFLSVALYAWMGILAVLLLVWRIKIAGLLIHVVAQLGASMAFLALLTGSIWGKPMWGTWWVWDARLTSELVLLFLYLGYMALRSSFDDRDRADRASAVLAIVGVINVPIIHYSVEWWTTLHQPASVTRLAKPAIALPMLVPLFIMLVGYQLYFGWLLCRRLQGEILRRERSAGWLKEVG